MARQEQSKKRRNESLSAHLPYVDGAVEVEGSLKNYPEHGEPSSERHTDVVEGNRYSPSLAAALIEYKWGEYLLVYSQQDLLAACGGTPRRIIL